MSQAQIKQAIADKKIKCPNCKQPIQSFEKYSEMLATVWDGAGDSATETQGSKVTLICGSCDWRERTEFWATFIEE